jgi:ABC-type dipeptide/oligopeptide/nickel transport system ATPase component
MKHLRLFEEFGSKKTIVIFGLPGSGKSHLAQKIMSENPEAQYVIYDDFGYRKALDKMGTENQIVSDGMLMIGGTSYNRTKFEEKALATGTDLEFIYFENDPKASIENIEARKSSDSVLSHQKHMSPRDIHAYSSGYEIPSGTSTIRVWKSSQ